MINTWEGRGAAVVRKQGDLVGERGNEKRPHLLPSHRPIPYVAVPESVGKGSRGGVVCHGPYLGIPLASVPYPAPLSEVPGVKPETGWKVLNSLLSGGRHCPAISGPLLTRNTEGRKVGSLSSDGAPIRGTEYNCCYTLT